MPSPNNLPPAPAYIARSATIGTLEAMAADTSVLARSGDSVLTQMFVRLAGGSTYVLTSGGAGAGRR